MLHDEKYMARCIQLAKLGRGNVAPNPLVGAVIVHEGKIIGEGFHKMYGGSHAEVNAVNSVNNEELLKSSTIYVSLEPCAHHGKTPPCADLLVEKQFQRVVIGCRDAHSAVDGKGIFRLKNAGIQVTTGVLEEECRELNKAFFVSHEKGRPYIFLKWAQTPSGLIDGATHDGKITWISTPEVQTLVHTWRSEYQSILVGKNTVKNDNPSLTVRAVAGNNPIRIVLDSSAELDSRLNVFDGTAKTIVLNTKRKEQSAQYSFLQLDEMTPAKIVSALHQEGIQSVMIEGGARTLQSFIDANLWDEAKVIVGQVEFDHGTLAPVIHHTPYHIEQFFGDQIKSYMNR